MAHFQENCRGFLLPSSTTLHGWRNNRLCWMGAQRAPKEMQTIEILPIHRLRCFASSVLNVLKYWPGFYSCRIGFTRDSTMDFAFWVVSLNNQAHEASSGRPGSRAGVGVSASPSIYSIRTLALMHVYTLGSILPSSPERLMQASSISTNGHCLCKAPGHWDEPSLPRFLIEPP